MTPEAPGEVPAAPRRVAPTRPSPGDALNRLGPRLVPVVAFAAVAGFAAAHWSLLVTDPPLGRAALVVAIATAGGVACAAVRGPARHGSLVTAARVTVLVAAAALAFAAMGLPAALLWPGGWDELAAGIGRGLGGLRTLGWPYGGPDPWVRLTLLLAVPLTLSAAAALTFWPSPGRGRALGMGGLVLLLALYGTAVAQHDPGAPLVRGGLLLALLAAWLFLPRIRRGGMLVAAGMLLVALAASLPLAGGLGREEPVVDYRSWRWVGDPTRFDWTHGYGPIDWPRRGDTVLTVLSGRAHYWKAAVLDRFDGLRWVRSEEAASAVTDPVIPEAAPERWRTDVEVTVGALDSTLLVTPGVTEAVEGLDEVTLTREGAARVEDELEQGETYTVQAYAPNPSAERMRAAPDPSPLAVRSATLVHLPAEGTTNVELVEAREGVEPSVPGRPVTLPRYSDGLGATPGAEAYILSSPYAPVYRQARRIVRGAPTTYDAVRRVESHLRTEYDYSEEPPVSEYPLVAFLTEDRAGYCQQFSGAMALMLRMNGIPARVASGFAPGERSAEGGEFTVRDLDAHSWVEVYFADIGWVPFDPTPPDAPAASRADGTLASAARGGDGDLALDLAERLDGGAASPSAEADTRTAGGQGGEEAPGSGGSDASWLAPAAALIVLGGAVALRTARRRRAPAAEAPLRELERALRWLGHGVAPETTLLDLEARLAAAGWPVAASYVRRVREHRFAGGRPPADPGARRALRAALTAGAGPLGRARGYVALPPWRA